MRRPFVCLLPLLLIFPACGRSPSPPAAAPNLGHFRLKLLVSHTILDNTQPAEKPLKIYPPIVVAQTDFYLAEGNAPASFAFSDGNLLLLKLSDLKLSPDRAVFTHSSIDSNFRVQSVLGPLSAKSFTSTSTPPTTIIKSLPKTGTMTFVSKTTGNVRLQVSYDYEITYFGFADLADIMKSPTPPVTINHLSPDYIRDVESDFQRFSRSVATRPGV